jgi:hypothetical protein
MKLNEVKGDHGWKVEIVKDDQSISRLWIVDRQMRIGRCPVYTGGIAGVGTLRIEYVSSRALTDPLYRGRELL